MNARDDLPERLGELFRREAANITSPPDAWERYTADTGQRVVLEPSARHRRAWLGVPAGLVAAAAVIAVVVAIGSGTNSAKTSRAAAGAITVHGGESSSAAPAIAPVAGAAASGPGPAGAGAAPTFGAAPAAGSALSTATTAAAGASTATQVQPPVGGPVPPGFEPSSVTFVSLSEGWVLGTAPCSSVPCTAPGGHAPNASILRTTDGGRTWLGIPVSPTALSAAISQNPGSGVSQLRFADPSNGWAFGPDLWATHDGGASWQAVSLPGVPSGGTVMALEAAAGTVTAVVTDGSRLAIETSPVGQDAWAPAPVSVPIGAGPVPSAQLVLQGSSGWLVEVDRTVIGGARLRAGQWQAWTPPCLTGGGPVTLAASSPVDLVADCSLGIWTGTPQGNHLFVSQDGGTTFSEAPAAIPGDGAAIASPAPAVAVVGGTDLVATFDGGRTWTTVYRPTTTGGSGFGFVGFTSPLQGVAVTGQPGQGSTLLVTRDGGHTWSVVPF
jgi:photosystem II stability/assembly factor-like uncharacterized protein